VTCAPRRVAVWDKRGPIVPGSPAAAAKAELATRGWDRGIHPNTWLPWAAENVGLPICEICDCVSEAIMSCSNNEITQHSWVADGLSIPDTVRATYFTAM